MPLDSPRSDLGPLYVKPELLPGLSKLPNSSQTPRVFNKGGHTKSRSVPHIHPSKQTPVTIQASFLEDDVFVLKPSLFSIEVPSTPPQKQRHSSSFFPRPLSPEISFRAYSDPNPQFVFAIPVSPKTPTKTHRVKTPNTPSPHTPFPSRARATLAMSVQIHAAILDSPSNNFHQPSPRLPQRNLAEMHSKPIHSRRQSFNDPPSPTSASVIRPSSRSEKLLRDTLRRAEEHDRAHEHCSSPPIFSSSKVRRGDDCFECDGDDIDGLFRRSSYDSIPDSPVMQPKLIRHKSVDHKRARPSASPTSSRVCLRRSSNSVLPLQPHNGGPEKTTLHDAVLRSGLESVLQNTPQNRDKSLSKSRSHTRDSSEDWSSASGSPPTACSQQLPSSSPRNSIGPLTPPTTPPHSATILYQSPSYPSHRTPPRRSSTHPPTSPSFNARTASAMCRKIDGYVSFANVEGLGAPPEIIDEDGENVPSKGWLKWFGLKPTTVTINSSTDYSARA